MDYSLKFKMQYTLIKFLKIFILL